MKVYPSMLSANPCCYKDELLKISSADGIHWDVMDGNFVDEITFGANTIKAHRNLTKQEFHVHLMVNEPEQQIERFIKAGADTLIVHCEATHKLRYCLNSIRSFDIKAGVAISPATSPDFIKYTEDVLDTILVMTVEPGKAGQAFIQTQLEKIKYITNIISNDIDICVDGAIDNKMARICENVGVTSCVSGSYIFASKDCSEAIDILAGRV